MTKCTNTIICISIVFVFEYEQKYILGVQYACIHPLAKTLLPPGDFNLWWMTAGLKQQTPLHHNIKTARCFYFIILADLC